jgi:hypothetical protein
MQQNLKKVERRKNKRYLLKKNICASIGGHGRENGGESNGGRGSANPITGQIVNISMSGIALRYILNKNMPQVEPSVIHLGENDSQLSNIPFISVNDLSVSTPDPYSSVEIRQHSGMFDTLTHDQTNRLILFIENNASVAKGSLAETLFVHEME